MKHSSRTKISRQQPFLRAHIIFIPRCHEKELTAIFKLPSGNARVGWVDLLSNGASRVELRYYEWKEHSN